MLTTPRSIWVRVQGRDTAEPLRRTDRGFPYPTLRKAHYSTTSVARTVTGPNSAPGTSHTTPPPSAYPSGPSSHTPCTGRSSRQVSGQGVRTRPREGAGMGGLGSRRLERKKHLNWNCVRVRVYPRVWVCTRTHRRVCGDHCRAETGGDPK